MDKLIIRDIRLYGYHGVYEEESLRGQPFLLQVELGIEERRTRSEELSSTVNYAQCYEIIKEEFSVPRLLLENLCLDIMGSLFAYDERIKKVKLRIEKLRPPVSGDLGALGVELCRNRESFYP